MKKINIYNNNIYYNYNNVGKIEINNEYCLNDLLEDMESITIKENKLKKVNDVLINNIDCLNNPCNDIEKRLKACLSCGKAKDIKEMIVDLLDDIEGWSENLNECIYNLKHELKNLSDI